MSTEQNSAIAETDDKGENGLKDSGVAAATSESPKEFNGDEQNDSAEVPLAAEQTSTGYSGFGANLKAKALHARDGLKDKVGDIKGKFTRPSYSVAETDDVAETIVEGNSVAAATSESPKESNGDELNNSAESPPEAEPTSAETSGIGANLKTKALHAKDGLKDKVGDLKGKFARLKRTKVSIF